jgi:hypothetical protein
MADRWQALAEVKTGASKTISIVSCLQTLLVAKTAKLLLAIDNFKALTLKPQHSTLNEDLP